MKNINRYLILLIVFIGLEFLLMKEIITFPRTLGLFGLELRVYGLVIILAVIITALLVDSLIHQLQISKKFKIDDLILITVVTGIIGARIYHVITDWQLYTENPLSALYIWNGGVGIIGAIIGGAFGVYLYARKIGVKFMILLDIILLYLPLAQILGRFGNLINIELYGYATDLPWAWQISSLQASFHPTFLYEQLGNLALLTVLLYLWKKRNIVFGPGVYALVYLAGYAFIRFIVEFYRTHPRVIFDVLTVNQAVCLVVLLVVGIIVFKLNYKKQK